MKLPFMVSALRAPAALSVAGILILFFCLGTAQAQTANSPTYVEHLVTQTMQAQPDLLDIIFHATPPGSRDNIAVASFTAKERGRPSGADDLGVMTTGAPLTEIQKDGVRIGVLVPLKDAQGKTIGALGLMYPYKTGEAPSRFLKRSLRTRDRLASEIPSEKSLFKQTAKVR